MKILTDKTDSITSGSVCAIGSFDGVHRGHQEIVKRLMKLAGSEKKVGIITFMPLPFFVLKSVPIIYLTSKKEKEKIFQELRVDFVYYFRFTQEFSRMEPEDFVELISLKIVPSTVVVGENFHFGKARRGSAGLLKRLAKDKFSVDTLPRVEDDGIISSTRIRELLLLGHIKAANRLLGRQYMVSGIVAKGKGKGTSLGFPTINIKVKKEKLLPLDGVYKVRVLVGKEEFLGAMFCRDDLVEINILDFSSNIYKKEVAVKLLKRIRDIERFADDEQLRAAIARDVEAIRR